MRPPCNLHEHAGPTHDDADERAESNLTLMWKARGCPPSFSVSSESESPDKASRCEHSDAEHGLTFPELSDVHPSAAVCDRPEWEHPD